MTHFKGTRDLPRAIHLSDMKVTCTLCGWSASQIDSSREQCERVLGPLMDAHQLTHIDEAAE